MNGYPDPPGRSKAMYHWPRLYRYSIAEPGFRAMWNRYPGATIGVAMAMGRYAYCIKWARLGPVNP